MELKDLITLTANLSFSIAVAWFLLVFITKRITSTLEGLVSTLSGMQKVLQEMNYALQILLISEGGHQREDIILALKNLSDPGNGKGSVEKTHIIRT